MSRILSRMLLGLLLFSSALLPASLVKCDLEDGEFKIDLDDLDICDDDGCWVDIWYPPCYACKS